MYSFSYPLSPSTTLLGACDVLGISLDRALRHLLLHEVFRRVNASRRVLDLSLQERIESRLDIPQSRESQQEQSFAKTDWRSLSIIPIAL